jgi:hypothetical protein
MDYEIFSYNNIRHILYIMLEAFGHLHLVVVLFYSITKLWPFVLFNYLYSLTFASNNGL